ncbi:hypothetical protein D3C86_1846080 [compost metagenome]
MLGRGQRLAADHADHALDAGIDAAIEIALLKARHDDFADDALGRGIVQRAFQAVAHLDAQAAIVLGHDQQGAVVDVPAPQLPLLDYP